MKLIIYTLASSRSINSYSLCNPLFLPIFFNIITYHYCRKIDDCLKKIIDTFRNFNYGIKIKFNWCSESEV